MRLAAASALAVWLECIRTDGTEACYQRDVQHLYKELLVYLDDPDGAVQDAVLGESCGDSCACVGTSRSVWLSVKRAHKHSRQGSGVPQGHWTPQRMLVFV